MHAIGVVFGADQHMFCVKPRMIVITAKPRAAHNSKLAWLRLPQAH